MGVTRKDLFTNEQNELADLARVLGHPARIAILQHLERVNACITGDIVDEIGLAQATISQHLKALKSVGLIQGNIEGVSVNYCLDMTGMQRAKALMQGLFEVKSQKTSSDCC
jgi:DNA-binding transcriptional ArsR family regulator